MAFSYERLNEVLGLLSSELSLRGHTGKDTNCRPVEPPDEEAAAKIRGRLVELQQQRLAIEQEQMRLQKELQRIDEQRSAFLNTTLRQVNSLVQTIPHSSCRPGIAAERRRQDRGLIRGSSTDCARAETHDPCRRAVNASSLTSGNAISNPVPLPQSTLPQGDPPKPLPRGQSQRWGSIPGGTAARPWAPPPGTSGATRTVLRAVGNSAAGRDGQRRSKSVDMMPHRLIGEIGLRSQLASEVVLSPGTDSSSDVIIERSRTAEFTSPKVVDVPSGVGARATRSNSAVGLSATWSRDSESTKPNIPRLPLHVLSGSGPMK